ncbi:hypothetical protein L7F22_067295, partial [Adiantum nelumboides]|nr:hypothetical protein [Adiantum nelumboides]
MWLPWTQRRSKRGRRLKVVSSLPLESSDNVPSVLGNQMIEGLETQEEEIHSLVRGEGSLHEVEETLVPEENNLQIIPWEMKDEVVVATKMITSKIFICTKVTWDPVWNDINDEFEAELRQKPKFEDLRDHMFYVWEGNHRTLAWIEAIREKLSTSQERHCRILCTVIDPTKIPEFALLSSLQRMNL